MRERGDGGGIYPETRRFFRHGAGRGNRLRGRRDRTGGCRKQRKKATAGGLRRASRGRVGRMRALRAPLQTLDGKNRREVSGRRRRKPCGLFGFSVFRFALFVPAAQIEGNSHTGG